MKTLITIAGLLSLAACGGGSSPAAVATPEPVPTATGALRQGFPGVSGLLAELSGTTMQVQSATAQTAVTYSGSTTFMSTVQASAGDVTVGSCVVVRDASTAGGAAPTATTAVTATTVAVSAPVDGECARGFGAGMGRPAGGGVPPSGAPTDGTRPMGQGGRGFGGAVGKVVSTTGSGFVMESTPAGSDAVATQVTVTTTADTTFTASKASTAAALKVGTCVTAQGEADDTGAVAATSVSVRPATDGTCSQGGVPGA